MAGHQRQRAWSRVRKRPVIVEALQLDVAVEIDTREGTVRADPGDWLMRGVEGELYPCSADVFDATYETVDENAAPIALEDVDDVEVVEA